MADTDATSAAFARDASQKMDMVQNDTKALRPILAGLMFSNELHLLDQFEKHFANYRALDRTILDLSVENTNLKAQRLSIGPAQELVEGFRGALEQVASGAPASDSWHIRALAATALAAVREIEVLEASHIVEADDGAMTRLEKRMSSAGDTARNTPYSIGHAGATRRPSTSLSCRIGLEQVSRTSYPDHCSVPP